MSTKKTLLKETIKGVLQKLVFENANVNQLPMLLDKAKASGLGQTEVPQGLASGMQGGNASSGIKVRKDQAGNIWYNKGDFWITQGELFTVAMSDGDGGGL